jgi:hypothetical protein
MNIMHARYLLTVPKIANYSHKMKKPFFLGIQKLGIEY